MQSYTAGAIDLPPPPEAISDAPQDLTNSPVHVHVLDGRSVEGQLEYLSYAQKQLVIGRPAKQDRLKLTFKQLAYLSFRDNLAVNIRGETPSHQPVRPPQDQIHTFKVALTNRQEIAGNMRTAFLDGGGLHVFQLTDGGHVIRLFFPQEAIAGYQLGEQIGEMLLHENKISVEQLEKALSKQRELRNKRIGDYLVESSRLSKEQLTRALSEQHKQQSKARNGETPQKIGDILMAEGSLTPEDIEKALARQKADRDRKLGDFLVEMGATDEDEVHRALAGKLGLPFIKLESVNIQEEALDKVPGSLAQKFNVMPLKMVGNRLMIAVDDPFNKEAVDTIQFITNTHLELSIATAGDIEKAILHHYSDANLNKDILDAENLHKLFDLDSQQQAELKEAERLGDGAPVVRLVTKLIVDAIRQRASDIHIRPGESEVDLLFRVDGNLRLQRTFNKALLNAVIGRIKIIGKMDITERRLPQDGRAQMIDGANRVDLRISVVPTVKGESAVIRLLNSRVGLKSINDLGFNPVDAENFADMLSRSYGLVLVTGPTGSGKSTTLYAALRQVIERNLNIITVEDPVEYRISGINQIQVNTVPGYTFARALRNILRHDPDVIMIGEIRDVETGKIAVESALTGHLVLSTLHTNNAPGAITRLLEMGMDPFMLNGTLLGVFAQRLVRRNCESCLAVEPIDPLARKALQIKPDETFFAGTGCNECHGTGIKGRVAAYELLQMTPALRALVHEGVSVDELRAQALRDGMVPLTDNALELARSKVIPLAEAYRVRLE